MKQLAVSVTSDDLNPDALLAHVGDPAVLAYMFVQSLRRARQLQRRLLRCHAATAATVGMLMLTTGTAQAFEQNAGTWTRPCLGVLALVGGLVLEVGLDGGAARRHVPEAVGLSIIAVWYSVMGASFVLSLAVYGRAPVVRWPWDLRVIDLLQPRPYGPALYAGFAVMLLVHLLAVWADRRADDQWSAAAHA